MANINESSEFLFTRSGRDYWKFCIVKLCVTIGIIWKGKAWSGICFNEICFLTPKFGRQCS